MARIRSLGYGEGSVYKEIEPQTGAVVRWRGEITLDGKRHRPSGYKRSEVVAKLDELRGQVAAGEDIPNENTTVGKWMDWWLARISAGKDPRTYDRDQWAAGHLGSIAHKELRELRRIDVQACLTKLATRKKRPLGTASLAKVRSVLAQAIDEAIEHHPELGVTRNVARGRWSPPEAQPSKGVREMTREEARTLIKAAKGTDLEAMVLLMLFMPIRPGEVAGLRWGALDLKASTIAIKANRKMLPDGSMTQGRVKAYNDRTAKLPPRVVAALKAHQSGQRKARMAAPVWATPGDYVFCNEIGEPIGDVAMHKMFSRFTEKAGVGKFSPNSTRHAAISYLVDSGVPLQDVADLAGNTLPVMARNYRYRVAGVIDVTEAQSRMLQEQP